MKITIWKKNKEQKIEIVSKEETDTPESVTKKAVLDSIFSSLIPNIDYGYINEEFRTLQNVRETVELCKTDLVNCILKDTILTVSFNKKDGTERILTGYTNGDKDSFGRFYFIEIGTILSDEQIRLVDPRELNWICSPYDKGGNFLYHLKYAKPAYSVYGEYKRTEEQKLNTLLSEALLQK